MSAPEELQNWHAEILAELEAANRDLAASGEALAAAQLVRDAAISEQRRVAALLESMAGDRERDAHFFGQRATGMPSALASRLDPVTRAAHAAEGGLSMAKQQMENIKRRVVDIQDALQRLDRAMNPAAEETEMPQ